MKQKQKDLNSREDRRYVEKVYKSRRSSRNRGDKLLLHNSFKNIELADVIEMEVINYYCITHLKI